MSEELKEEDKFYIIPLDCDIDSEKATLNYEISGSSTGINAAFNMMEIARNALNQTKKQSTNPFLEKENERLKKKLIELLQAE